MQDLIISNFAHICKELEHDFPMVKIQIMLHSFTKGPPQTAKFK